MNATVKILILLALLSNSALSQALGSSASIRSADKLDLLKLIDKINIAYVNRNHLPFEEYYLDSFVRIRSRPIYNAKPQIVAMMKADGTDRANGKRLDFETLSYESRNPKITFFGTVAVVRSVRFDRWRYRSSECATRSPTTDVWISRAGNWRMFSSHATTIPCRPMPWVPLHPAVEAVGTTSSAPVAGTAEEVELSSVFALDGRRPALTFAPNYAHTDMFGNTTSDNLAIAAVNEPINDEAREDDGLIVVDDAGLFMFRSVRMRGGVRVREIYSIVLARTDGRWRIVASHCSRAD